MSEQLDDVSENTFHAAFLSGFSGEMAARVRAHDWSSTSLGTPDSWPQSLRTAIRIMLSSRYAMWMAWGKDLTFFCNDAYKPTLGIKEAWALGARSDRVWAEIWPDIGPRIDRVLTSGEATWDEDLLLFLERSGAPEETYHTFSYSPLADDEGAITGMLCVVTEVTDRVLGGRRLAVLSHLGARLAESRTPADVFEAISASLAGEARDLPLGLVYLFDERGETARLAFGTGIVADPPTAPETRAATGPEAWPTEPTIAAPVELDMDELAERLGVLPDGPWERPPSRALVLPLAGQGQARATGVFVAGLNPYRPLDTAYRGFIELFVGQVTAGLANAHAYEEERRRAEALAEIDRAKTLFFSNISHEFRTPLTLMLGPLEDALAADDLSPGQEARLELAQRNSLRLLRLVNALLDFSRIEAGRVRARFQATDLANFTAELAASFRSATERAGLDLVVDCSAVSEPVYVDRDMWEKIVLNLVSNAFKFTFEGSITVRLRPTEGGVRLTVQDTGTGIPAAEVPRLFERFHRVEGAQGRSFEGSGIGLALVQELVRLHGGEIAVESAFGRGTTFSITLPRGMAHLPPESIDTDAEDGSTGIRSLSFVEEALRWLPETRRPDGLLEVDPEADAPAVEQRSATERPNVLVADDNADLRAYMTRLLGERGYAVEAVADGQAALDRIRAKRPDLLVTDVMMPRLDGSELLRAVRGDAGLRDLPVIMLSAHAGEEAKVAGLDAGADDYLTKPFSARELLARVSANLGMARVRREAAEAVQASEARAGRVLAGMTEAYVLLDRDFRVVEINEEGLRLERRPRETILGKTHWEAWPGTEGSEQGRLYRRAMRERIPVAVDVHHVWPDGHDAWVEVRAYPTEDGLAIFYRDVTERKRAEARQLFRLELSDALRELSEPRAMMQAAVEVIGRHLAANRVGYGLIRPDDDTVVLETEYVDGVQHLAGEYRLDAFGPGNIANLRAGRTSVYADVEADPATAGIGLDRFGIAALVAVPLVRDGRLRASLYVNQSRPRDWRPDEVLLIEDVASRIWDAVERARAQDELQELNATLEARVIERTDELERAQAALRQAQKMEAVGQLTGGIAHDFNNLLTVINGNVDMARRALVGGEASRAARAMDNAQKGAERAAALTQRLLAFSRRQPLRPKPVDVDKLVAGMSDLLNRALGERIKLEIVTNPGLWRVEVDPNQLESAIINLAVNARDAMPSGGTLTIETANARLDEVYSAAHAEVAPGNYVVIAVTDTGAGMSKETLARAFEPFFTTKEVGKGTGLGLSMIYGFVKQSGGHVKIYSEEGDGTTVKLYLPRLISGGADEEPEPEPVDGAKREHTILVVEDDDDVRAYTVEILRELGYRVLEAHDGASALRLIERQGLDVDMLFTDVVMPGMSGRELAEEARFRVPELKVLYTSGYTRNAIVHGGRLDTGVEMISKPFTYAGLAQKVRDVLETGDTGRVLVVEHDAAQRLSTAEALVQAGYAIEEAANAAEALGKVRASAGRYDFVLIGDGLPGKAAAGLATELRAMHKDLPLLLTGHDGQTGLREQFAGDRCVGVIGRPYSASKLQAALTSLGIRCRAQR